MDTCLLHIGYSRTGTTWLQRFVFESPDTPFVRLNVPKKENTWRMVKVHPLDFDAGPVRAQYQDRFAAVGQPYKCPVVSNERLSGTALSGGFDTKEIADRLHAVFPEGRVLICIREQTEAIRSAYNNYICAGGTCKLEDYLKPPLRSYRLPHFELDYFSYHKLIAYYRRLFGEERVLVLPYEHFQAAPAEYVAAIYEFCGLEMCQELPYGTRVKTSSSPGTTSVLRLLNAFTKRDPANGYSGLAVERLRPWLMRGARTIDGWLSASTRKRSQQRLAERIARLVDGYYLESNRITDQYSKVSLSEYGYY